MDKSDVTRRFRNVGIPDDLYWLGPVDGAEMQNGLVFIEGKWVVYYRERGQVLNCEYFNKMDDAVRCLENRLLRLISYYDNFDN